MTGRGGGNIGGANRRERRTMRDRRWCLVHINTLDEKIKKEKEKKRVSLYLRSPNRIC